MEKFVWAEAACAAISQTAHSQRLNRLRCRTVSKDRIIFSIAYWGVAVFLIFWSYLVRFSPIWSVLEARHLGDAVGRENVPVLPLLYCRFHFPFPSHLWVYHSIGVNVGEGYDFDIAERCSALHLQKNGRR